MANIAVYRKQFEAGPNGADASGAFSNSLGVAPTYTNSPTLEGNFSCKFTLTATDTSTQREDDVSRSLVWRLFRFRLVTAPSAVTTFLTYFQGTGSTTSTKLGDMRVTADRMLTLRDMNTAVFTGTVPLALNTTYWIALKVDMTNRQQRCKLYSAAGVLLEDSANKALTNSTGTAVDNFRWGVPSATAAMTYIIDDLRGDDSTELIPASSGVTANAGTAQTGKVDGQTVTLTGSASGGTGGPYTYTWTQTSGTTVTLSGTGATRTFTVPSLATAETAIFQLTASDGVNTSGTDTVSVGMLGAIVPNAGVDQNVPSGAFVTLSGSATGGNGTYTYAWTQISGSAVTLVGSGANRTFTAPTVQSATTLTFRLNVTDSAGSALKSDVMNVNVGVTSSAIAAYTKNFNGGTNGAAAGTEFSSGATTNAPTYTNSPALEGAMSIRFNVTAATSIAREDDIARSLIWRLFRIYVVTRPASSATIFNWFSGGVSGTKIGDIHLNSNGTLQLNDGNTAVFNGTQILALNTQYFIAIKVAPGSATGHRYKVYSAAGTLLEDSLDRAATAAGVVSASGVDTFRSGIITTDTMNIVMDDFRGDAAAEIFPPSAGIIADAGPDQINKPDGATIVLSANASGGAGTGYTYAWTQTAGTTVTLTGTGANRSFTAPSLTSAQTLTFQVTVTDSAGSTAGVDSVNVSVLPKVVVNAGIDQTVEPYSNVSMTASASGGSGAGYVYSWTQLTGTAVTLNGTGATRTFVAGAYPDGELVTFSVSATDSAGSAPQADSIIININAYDNFYKSGSVFVPFRIWERNNGIWRS